MEVDAQKVAQELARRLADCEYERAVFAEMYQRTAELLEQAQARIAELDPDPGGVRLVP